jgi:alkyldihydroxyacetonephosphate synthase
VPLADRVMRDLEAIFSPRRVSVRGVDLDTYSRDMWPRALLGYREGEPVTPRPDVVVWPENVREVVAAVKLAREHKIPIVPYGGGSGVCGGAMPVRGGITIDTKRMQALRSIHGDDMICDVEAGLNGERFERELARRGFTFGHFPSSIYCSTVGGWVATRAAGQLSTKYGKVEDRVAGLSVVTGRGELIETDGPNRALRGPSWNQILLGSEGTLGVITSARLRVSPAPQLRVFRGFEIDSVEAGAHAIRRVLQKGLRPAVVRLYDELDTLINAFGHDDTTEETAADPMHGLAPRPPIETGALPVIPSAPQDRDSGILGSIRDLVRGKGLRAAGMNAALGSSDLMNKLFGAVEKVARRGCRLIIGLEGARIRTEIEAALTFAELEAAGARDRGEDPGWAWLRHRYAVSYRMSPVFRDGAFVDTMEVAASWDKLLDLYHSVRVALGKHALVMAHLSHAYADGCSIYFTFVGTTPARDGAAAARRKYDAIWRDGLEATTRVGGTISHHHGVGLLKAPYMQSEHREAMAIFQAAKTSLDPDGIMNPGKMGLR